jgi:phage baseplate assembly protein W
MLPIKDFNGRVFPVSYSNEEQALSNIKNLLLTRIGERFFHPFYGTNIIDSLFENNVEGIRDGILISVTNAMAYWLPYIKINDLTVTVPDFDPNVSNANLENVILIKLDYSVGNENVNRSITFGIDPTGNVRSI